MSLLPAQLPDAAGAYVFCLPSKKGEAHRRAVTSFAAAAGDNCVIKQLHFGRMQTARRVADEEAEQDGVGLRFA